MGGLYGGKAVALDGEEAESGAGEYKDGIVTGLGAALRYGGCP